MVYNSYNVIKVSNIEFNLYPEVYHIYRESFIIVMWDNSPVWSGMGNIYVSYRRQTDLENESIFLDAIIKLCVNEVINETKTTNHTN